MNHQSSRICFHFFSVHFWFFQNCTHHLISRIFAESEHETCKFLKWWEQWFFQHNSVSNIFSMPELYIFKLHESLWFIFFNRSFSNFSICQFEMFDQIYNISSWLLISQHCLIIDISLNHTTMILNKTSHSYFLNLMISISIWMIFFFLMMMITLKISLMSNNSNASTTQLLWIYFAQWLGWPSVFENR